ncbi:MAG: amidase [Acidobacteriia bacterium]|nr:amidase [Terriglobia bacterium]
MSEAVRLCLERIHARESDVRAWTRVEPQEPLGDGPLNGVPFGVKDIFDTQALFTEYGSLLFKGRQAERDAALVELLRRRGAVMLGKTQTTAFAYFDPAPTRNPRNLAHTPGGSSSGSAAAVADGMAEFALGTQTQGSVIRPASFCGVVGLKPTHGLLPLEGVLAFAPSFDTAGLFTASALRMRRLWQEMGFAADSTPVAGLAALVPPPEVEEPMRQTFLRTAERLGAPLRNPPFDWNLAAGAVRCINHFEGARTHEQLFRTHGVSIGRKLAELIERGLAMGQNDYEQARQDLRDAAQSMEEFFAAYPVVLTPAALGAAPPGLSSTGDPHMNGVWTGLGVPAITVPMPAGGGLPLGLQMIAPRAAEAMLLATACMVENELAH